MAAIVQRKPSAIPIHWIGCGQKPASTCRASRVSRSGEYRERPARGEWVDVHLDDARPARQNERLRELLLADRAEHRLDRTPPVRVERAAEVGDVDAREAAEHPVDHTGRQRPAPRVAPRCARPAGDVGAGLDRVDEQRQILGGVLEVAVHRHEDVAARADETRVHRRVLAEVALEPDRAHAPVGRVDALELGESRVGRAVVDEDQLECARRLVERLDGSRGRARGMLPASL